MLLLFLLVAQGQTLPAELQTVTLKITQIQKSETAGEAVYVIVSAEQFDAGRPVQIKTYRAVHARIKGKHMERITREIARDPQCVFVVAGSLLPLDLDAVLLRAGITRA